jgi:glutamate racemase
LGDNARAPYGTRSFETVYEYTLECVKKLFELDCELVLLACNTASAKALRTIQQKDLLSLAPNKRVLGVIRPTTEIVGNYTKTNVVGVLGTSGTITSNSYPIEIEKFYPQLTVVQEACPMWVPLVENNEFESEGADYFIQKNLNSLLEKGKNIDTIILGCTHYPLLINKIKKFLPEGIKLISQGEIVATSLIDYLNRHAEIEQQLSKGKSIQYLTTDSSENFDKAASIFVGEPIQSKHIDL